MKKSLFFLLCTGLLLFSAVLTAENAPDPQIAELGEKLAAAAASSEEAFHAGLLAADMRSKQSEILQPVPEIVRVSGILSQKVRFKGAAGCDGTLIFNWLRARELQQMLSRQICNEQVDFTVKLEKAAGADSALLAQNCVAADLQLPNRYTLNSLKSKRDYGEFKKNLEFLSENLKRRSAIPMAEQWRQKINNTLFLFWAVQQNAALMQEAEQPGTAADYLLRQLNDAKNLSCAALYTPKNSYLNLELAHKHTAIRSLCSLYQGFLRRRKDGRELVKYFANAARLEQIRVRWFGNTPYFFYWADIAAEELGDQADARLLEQIPATMELVAQKSKEKEAKEKQAKAEKKTKDKKARLRGKRHEQNAEAPAAPAPAAKGGVPAPAAKGGAKPAEKNPIFKSIQEYNTEIFENGGNLRREARTAVSFRKDMVEYAKIISSIAKGVTEFQSKYPDAVLISRQRTLEAGK